MDLAYLQHASARCAHAAAQYELGSRLCEEMLHEMEMRRGLQNANEEKEEEEEEEEEDTTDDQDERGRKRRRAAAAAAALWLGRDEHISDDARRPIGAGHQPQPWVYGHDKDALVDAVSECPAEEEKEKLIVKETDRPLCPPFFPPMLAGRKMKKSPDDS